MLERIGDLCPCSHLQMFGNHRFVPFVTAMILAGKIWFVFGLASVELLEKLGHQKKRPNLFPQKSSTKIGRFFPSPKIFLQKLGSVGTPGKTFYRNFKEFPFREKLFSRKSFFHGPEKFPTHISRNSPSGKSLLHVFHGILVPGKGCYTYRKVFQLSRDAKYVKFSFLAPGKTFHT